VPEGLAAVEFLRALPLGTRVVVRRREDDGFHDALGDLVGRDDLTYTVVTRTGSVTLPLSTVTRAKTVPPPPPRRAARFPLRDQP